MLVLLFLLILALLIQYLRIVAEIRAENIDKVRVFWYNNYNKTTGLSKIAL